MTVKPNPIRAIVSHFRSQTALAEAIGTRQSTVWEWVNAGRVPSSRIPDVIAAAALLNPPVELRPDHFFGTAEVPASARAA